ncbi:hypothetical protein LUZ60_012561 [Juncus effusus]|nr:hypothetical protein LUZ60_012561 [Juncus effusus]
MEQEQEYHNNNWDLQAVVRGYLPPPPATNPFGSFSFNSLVVKEEEYHDSICSFPDLMATPSGLHELEELCKCFLPKSTGPTCQTQVMPVQLVQPVQRNKPNRPAVQTPRSKRRKNQQKVVCQVPADGLSSDMWAWRKYGQKPIKGSPYPRGYYRCSSSKGCLARKQVERSRTDPGMFIITYTAEHNHPVPTHRNSLAGITRQKFPTTSAASVAGGGGSPTTPLMASMEDELLHGEVENEEELEGGLGVEDMKMCGDDEFLFWGQEQDGEDVNACIQLQKIRDDFSDESCFNPPPCLAS